MNSYMVIYMCWYHKMQLSNLIIFAYISMKYTCIVSQVSRNKYYLNQ